LKKNNDEQKKYDEKITDSQQNIWPKCSRNQLNATEKKWLKIIENMIKKHGRKRSKTMVQIMIKHFNLRIWLSIIDWIIGPKIWAKIIIENYDPKIWSKIMIEKYDIKI